MAHLAELQHHGCRQGSTRGAVRYIAAELGPKGIRVHAVSPGRLGGAVAGQWPILAVPEV